MICVNKRDLDPCLEVVFTHMDALTLALHRQWAKHPWSFVKILLAIIIYIMFSCFKALNIK